MHIEGQLYDPCGYAVSGVLVCVSRLNVTVIVADGAVYYANDSIPHEINVNNCITSVGGGMTALISDMFYDWDNNVWVVGGEHVQYFAVYYRPLRTYTFFSKSGYTDNIIIRTVA